MSVSTRRYVRVPPDGAGKRVANEFTLYLGYGSRIQPIIAGDIIVGGTSNAQGTVLEVIEATGAVTGTLVLKMEGDNEDSSFTLGENLLINGVVSATASDTGTVVYYTSTVLVGGNDPTNKQYIDEEGSQNIRFSEGSPQFGSFGGLKFAHMKNIGEYTFVCDDDGKMYPIVTGSASSSYQPQDSVMLLTNTAGATDRITYRSNIWHKYEPGISFGSLFSLVAGDTGKTNLVRRWGMFDDNDGVFFEQSGSQLYVVQRSSVGGTVSETKVSQSLWNTDKVNGSLGIENVSKFNLDVSKANVYFIDYQWLGAGAVTFGMLNGDKRVVCHKIRNPNTLTRPYMKKGSLPATVEQENVGATSGVSEMRLICITVQSDSSYHPESVHHSNTLVALPFTASSYSENVPIFSARSAATASCGGENRSYSIPHRAELYCDIDTVITIRKGATLSGSNWLGGQFETTTTELDLSASGSSGGRPLFSTIVKAGEIKTVSLSEAFHDQFNWVGRYADVAVDPEPITVLGRPLSPSPLSGSLTITFDFNEYKQ